MPQDYERFSNLNDFGSHADFVCSHHENRVGGGGIRIVGAIKFRYPNGRGANLLYDCADYLDADGERYIGRLMVCCYSIRFSTDGKWEYDGCDAVPRYPFDDNHARIMYMLEKLRSLSSVNCSACPAYTYYLVIEAARKAAEKRSTPVSAQDHDIPF